MSGTQYWINAFRARPDRPAKFTHVHGRAVESEFKARMWAQVSPHVDYIYDHTLEVTGTAATVHHFDLPDGILPPAEIVKQEDREAA